jgi:hypothetical protein
MSSFNFNDRFAASGVGKKTIILAMGSVLGFSSFSAAAQSMTAQQLMQACETSPNNTVNLAQQVKLQGAFTGESYSSATGCTIALATDASFELDQITLNFSGPFVVTGRRNSKVQIEKAVVNAPSVDFNLTGIGSQFMMKEGRVLAAEGNLSLKLGHYSKLEIVDSGGWTRGGLTANGLLSISSYAYFSAALVNSGLEGGRGIAVTMSGNDSSWKIENSTLNASNFTLAGESAFTTGPLTIESSAYKNQVEIIDTNIRFASKAVRIGLSGAESTVLMKNVQSQTGSESVYFGASGYKGIVMLENSGFSGNPSVVVATGIGGSTAVVGSPGYLRAQGSIHISTKNTGSCVVTPISMLTAPQISVCR